MTSEKALFMRENCEKQAIKYSEERFVREIKEITESL